MKEWTVTIDVSCDEKKAAGLRTLLPKILEDAGYQVTCGTTTIESWRFRLMEKQPERFNNGPTNTVLEPGWIPSGKLKQR